MKFFFTISLLVIGLLAKGQENLMFKTDQEILASMRANNAKYIGVDYTNNGERCIKFALHTDVYYNFTEAVFFINDNKICDAINYYCPNQKYLDGIVTAINVIDDYSKVPDRFAWINTRYHFSVEIVRRDGDPGFIFQYNHLK